MKHQIICLISSAFEDRYGAKWPKAVAEITEHLDVLLAFYDYPQTTGSTCARPTRSNRRVRCRRQRRLLRRRS
jgi:hypothetical protein